MDPMSLPSARILVTGSRHHTDEHLIAAALADALTELSPTSAVTLVSGNARGADALAEKYADALGMDVERHPADWGKHGRAAGPKRNQQMVDLGADLCLAFPLEESRGTYDCIRRARAAGIEVRVIEPGS